MNYCAVHTVPFRTTLHNIVITFIYYYYSNGLIVFLLVDVHIINRYHFFISTIDSTFVAADYGGHPRVYICHRHSIVIRLLSFARL